MVAFDPGIQLHICLKLCTSELSLMGEDCRRSALLTSTHMSQYFHWSIIQLFGVRMFRGVLHDSKGYLPHD
jgi:hypothetical protein